MKIFDMDGGYTWHMAPALDVAFEAWADDCNEFPDCLKVENPEARELTDAEMDALFFVDDIYSDPDLSGTRRTFREEMRRRLDAGNAEPQFFATTEY